MRVVTLLAFLLLALRVVLPQSFGRSLSCQHLGFNPLKGYLGSICTSIPQSKALHVAYTIDDGAQVPSSGETLSQLELVLRSAWSAYTIGCGKSWDCRERLNTRVSQ
jgi:hypothetical protein